MQWWGISFSSTLPSPQTPNSLIFYKMLKNTWWIHWNSIITATTLPISKSPHLLPPLHSLTPSFFGAFVDCHDFLSQAFVTISSFVFWDGPPSSTLSQFRSPVLKAPLPSSLSIPHHISHLLPDYSLKKCQLPCPFSPSEPMLKTFHSFLYIVYYRSLNFLFWNSGPPRQDLINAELFFFNPKSTYEMAI